MKILSIEDASNFDPQSLPKRPVLAVRFGRGRTGGSTFLDWLIQRAREARREVIIGDGDRQNATLSSYYPPDRPGGAFQPRSAEIADVSDWITTLSGDMVSRRASLILDLGGGDRIIAEHSQELNLPDFCEGVGADPLAIYMVGPERDDFEHVLNIIRAGYFRSPHSLMVLNQSLVRAGKNAASAFDWLYKHPGYTEVSKAVKSIEMPRLGCMDVLRAEGLTFYEGLQNKPGKSGRPMDAARQFMIGVWMNKLEQQMVAANITDWLP